MSALPASLIAAGKSGKLGLFHNGVSSLARKVESDKNNELLGRMKKLLIDLNDKELASRLK